MKKIGILISLSITLGLFSGCKPAENANADKSQASKLNAKSTQISVTQVSAGKVETAEVAIGTLEGVIDPTVAAEISARVVQMQVRPGQAVKKGQTIALLDGSDFGLQRNEAQSEVARLETLINNQQKVVERNRALVDKNFISKNALDDASTQLDALRQQLAGAKSRIKTIAHNGAKNRIISPADGVVEKQMVGNGDYVRVGDPVVQIISPQILRAHIPFPESIASQLKAGLAIDLTTPTSSKTVRSVISNLKPQIQADSRTVDVVAEVRNEPDWQPGASVTGRIVLASRSGAFLVPEQSLVLRPAGEVIYLVEGDQVRQRVVKSGQQLENGIEILEGLQGNETIAVDGAAFLTDGAKISILNNLKSTKSVKSAQ